MEIIMAEKRDTKLISSEQQSEMTEVSESIVVSQKVGPTNLDTPEEQLERSISLEQEGFNCHPATGTYSSLYCPMVTILSGILATLSCWNQSENE